jgi:magnesium transporter
MRGYDYTAGKAFEAELPAMEGNPRIAFICNPHDVHSLMDIYGWDEDTVDECVNLDETVRYTSYDRYDFISLIYAEDDKEDISQREVNIFFSKDYLALVLPENADPRLSKLANGLVAAFPSAAARPDPLAYLYYWIFDSLAVDFSDMLEGLEDKIEALLAMIERKPGKEQSLEIGQLRKMAYTYKKLLRSLSYIGGQILVDENHLLDDSQERYFRNIHMRLIKLYDFADSLYGLSNELIHTYDSKFSAKMNETINKLTVITLLFGILTVIAGIYGMNFTYMPELDWRFGYPATLGLMAAVGIVIYIVLKKKKWL